MNAKLTSRVASFLAAIAAGTAMAAGPITDKQALDRGRYLVTIGGCNDCHTPGYAESAGNVPETERLTGSHVGFQGPWGTTYPANLRLLMQQLTEAQWLARARTAMRPPMPWFNLRDMEDDDLRAMYRYVRNLGARGETQPAYAAPGEPVNTPYFVFVPQNLPPQQHAAK